MEAVKRGREVALADWRLPLSGPDAVRLAAWCGAEWVQLDFGGPGRAPRLDGPGRLEEVQAASIEHGVGLAGLAVNALNDIGLHAATNSAAGVLARRTVEDALATATALSMPLMFLPSFRLSEIRDEGALSRSAELLGWACRLAEGSGVAIASENVLAPRQAQRLLELADHPGLWLVLDTYNPVRAGIDLQAWMEALSGRIHRQIHVKDGQAGAPAALGRGDGDVAATLERLSHSDGRLHVLENDYRGRDGWDRLRDDLAWLSALRLPPLELHEAQG